MACQFLQRQRILGIYRSMLKTIQQVPDEADRKYLRDWARAEFKRNKNATDQVNGELTECDQSAELIMMMLFRCVHVSNETLLLQSLMNSAVWTSDMEYV